MGYFQVRYNSRVVIYDRRGFIRLATGDSVSKPLVWLVNLQMPRLVDLGSCVKYVIYTCLDASKLILGSILSAGKRFLDGLERPRPSAGAMTSVWMDTNPTTININIAKLIWLIILTYCTFTHHLPLPTFQYV